MSRPTWPKLKFQPELPLTSRTFLKLCRANPDLRLQRTAQGELVIMAPAGADSGRRNLKLSFQLAGWVKRSGLGHAFVSSTGFTLPNGAIRSPDASWVTQDRWDALTDEEKQEFAPLCPDFVVELRSRSDRRKTLRGKMREYIAQGARLGWLIDLTTQEVEIYRPGRPVELLKAPRTFPERTYCQASSLIRKRSYLTNSPCTV